MVADFYAVPAGRQAVIEEYRPETVTGVELSDVFFRPLMTTCQRLFLCSALTWSCLHEHRCCITELPKGRRLIATKEYYEAITGRWIIVILSTGVGYHTHVIPAQLKKKMEVPAHCAAAFFLLLLCQGKSQWTWNIFFTFLHRIALLML